MASKFFRLLVTGLNKKNSIQKFYHLYEDDEFNWEDDWFYYMVVYDIHINLSYIHTPSLSHFNYIFCFIFQ